MDNQLFKKLVKQALKKASANLILTNIETKYKSDSLDMISDKVVIGTLGYAIVSNKFAEYGATLGVYFVCVLNDGKLTTLLKQLGLSFKNYFHLNHFFGFTSLAYLPHKFFKNGTISFYENDILDTKCAALVNKINELYSPKILNFITGNLQVIDDIFESPENYGFPLTYALIVCYINDRKDLVSIIVQRAKSKKWYDATQVRIDEILSKLDMIFI